MADAAELLGPYLRELVKVTGACDASVYLPGSLGLGSRGQVLHLGEAPSVPELATLDVAEAFASGVSEAATAGAARLGGDAAALPSVVPGGVLIPIPSVATLWERAASSPPPAAAASAPHAQRARDRARTSLGGSGWVGLRFDPRRPDSAADAFWQPALGLARALASYLVGLYGILADPVTGLPGRAAVQLAIGEHIELARRRARPFSLLLVNPHDFGDVNARHGCRIGDAVLRGVVVRLLAAVRASDPVMRYGAAIFAVALPDTDAATACRVADHVRRRLCEAPFLDGAVRLAFSVGIATLAPDDDEGNVLELVQRADLALAAARESEGGTVTLWSPGLERPGSSKIDRLGGIFTGKMDKDYRNMGLLWDALDVVAVNARPGQLAARVVERLHATLGPRRVALFTTAGDGPPRLVSGIERQRDAAASQPLAADGLTDAEVALVASAIDDGRPRHGGVGRPAGSPPFGYAVPLTVGDHAIGALYLAARHDEPGFDPSDLSFFSAFGAQVAVALDRARLAEQEEERNERERHRLRAELVDLRKALRQAKLLYRSPAMDAVLTMARRIAATDTTVLVTGESGTGKERLAQTIHDLSDRKSRPFVIVDCGAIPPTLIESELFGHERGAFTGAGERAVGRLAQADGGTVVLDEVGELPLEVQAKLLRFVQEKHVTPVGGTRPRRVDARILAVTNRDLEREVAEGRFREDLFYRINVVRLRVPPLRERRDDVLFLARHFIEVFSLQYGKDVRGITPEAEARMVEYAWPGNVRELQNRVLQAVILAGDELLDCAVLGIDAEEADEARRPERARAALTVVPPAPRVAGPSSDAPRPVSWRPAPPAGGDPWTALRQALVRQIAQAVAQGGAVPPLGRWLGHEVTLVGYERSGRVMARAAARLGVPETTFARRHQKAISDAALSRRGHAWDEVRDAIAGLLDSPACGQATDLADRIDAILLEEVVARTQGNAQRAAQLLGVSLPTFRRRQAAMPMAS
jgi:hydrogenase-4 transcriptional activator